jgi:hypothetical protein
VIKGQKRITTSKSALVIKGSTVGRTTAVTYRVGNRGAFKPTAGSVSWKFKAKLRLGKNPVTVLATGPGGTSAPAKMIVIRR